jgi:uncharacterized membrane protein required for colicin V production
VALLGPLASSPLAAAPRAADAAALILLLAFTWWGARKGGLRQALSLVVMAGAFLLAGRLAVRLEPTMGKLFDLALPERLALAWAAVLFVSLVLGALLLRLLAGGLPEHSRGGVDRVLGGLLGAAKGAVVLTLAGYLALGAGSANAAPPLSRPAQPSVAAEPGAGLSARVRGSLSAACLLEWGGLLRRAVELPPWVAERMQQVERELREARAEPASGARPSPR